MAARFGSAAGLDWNSAFTRKGASICTVAFSALSELTVSNLRALAYLSTLAEWVASNGYLRFYVC